MRSMQLTITLAVLALLATPWPARPESSEYRTRLTETSSRQALGGRAIPLLEVAVPGRRDDQLARLLGVLSESPDRRVHVKNPGRRSDSARSTVLFAADESWYLEVMGDGTRFRYRGNIDDPRERQAELTLPKLDLEALERLGREYVATRLASLVALGAEEGLVFLGSRYLREGSATAEQPFTSRVVGNVAVFGREVRGTFVAGPGSKIQVWFSNRGEPVAFFADWPAYQVLDRVPATLDIAGVRERLSRNGDHPLEAIDRNTRHFECGYVDLGATRRGRAPLQAGCMIAHAGPLPGDLTYGAIEAIPIGATVVEDVDWPVTRCVVAGRAGSDCRDEDTVPPASESGR